MEFYDLPQVSVTCFLTTWINLSISSKAIPALSSALRGVIISTPSDWIWHGVSLIIQNTVGERGPVEIGNLEISISLDINGFTLARDGQNSLAKSGQGQRLMQGII
jgi:hypothetical protein